jgi:hypothetical protein
VSEGAKQPGQRRTIDELIDRGDGEALARAAQANQSVRRHVEVQARIDQALRREFSEPDLAIRLPDRTKVWWQKWLPMAAAAVVLLAGLAGWRYWVVSNRPDILGPVYHRIVEAGFKPDAVCTTDEEFSGWTRQYLRQAMYPTSRPAGLEYVGWSSGRAVGRVSAILLARVEGQPVIVVMERTDRLDFPPGRVQDPALHLYRRQIGDVVLFEITPISHQTILPVIQAQPAR